MPSFSKIVAVLAASAVSVMALPSPQLDGLTGGLGGLTGSGTTGAVTGDLPAGTTADPAVSSLSAAQAQTPGSCSKGTTISCCNTDGASGLLGDVLGGSCEISNLAVLGVTTGSQCAGGNTYCCPTTQTGDLDINAACLAILA